MFNSIKENPNVSIPDGYRELEHGEVMSSSDIYYDGYGWETRGENSWGSEYRKSYFTTVRKIEKETIKKQVEYRYFLYNNSKNIIFACNEKGGYHINFNDGFLISIQYDKGNTIGVLLHLKRHYTELNQDELITYLSSDSLKKVFLELGISLGKIEVTEEQKTEILETLKKSRAFNGDSAMKMPEKEDLCFQLYRDGIIASEKDRFYLKNI